MIRHGDTIVIPVPRPAEAATTPAGYFRCGRCRVNVHGDHDQAACDAMLDARAVKNRD